MPPKGKKPEGPPPPPPEPNAEEQLPEDIRSLSEPPFPVRWQPVVTLVQLAPEVRPGHLKETLRRREQVRTPDMADLVLRVDPATPLGAEVRAAQDEHVMAGGTYETFIATPEQNAAILLERFERDRRVDWKFEYHRRRTDLQVFKDQVKATEEGSAAAAQALEAATVKLQQWREAQAAAKAAAAEAEAEEALAAGEDGASSAALTLERSEQAEAAAPGEEAELELSREEEMYKDAAAAAEGAEARKAEAAERLAEALVTLEQPFVCYTTYWVEGLAGGNAWEDHAFFGAEVEG